MESAAAPVAPAASSSPGRNLRRRNNNKRSSDKSKKTQELCFDLGDEMYGEFGMQTVTVPQENRRWFLRDEEVVSRGPCDPRKVETLRSRETKALSFCTRIGRTQYDIVAPRFLDSYLYERDAERGECVEKAEVEKKMVANSSQMSDMKLLCFDLRRKKMGEFGKQTLEVSSELTRFLTRDDAVSKGPCDGGRDDAEEELDRRELSELRYCAHRGPSNAGYEVELRVPRFLDDYLTEKGGVERGACRDSDADVLEARHVAEIDVKSSEK